MPRKAEPAPTRLAIAVAKAISARIEEVDMSQAAVSRVSGLSENYLSERLMLRKSFTLSDIDALGQALHFEPGEFLTSIDLDDNVVQLRPRANVSPSVEDLADEPFAADSGDEAVTPDEAGD